MAANTVEPLESDVGIAFRGLWMQAEAHGLEITDELRNFLEFLAQGEATHEAWMRFYQNILHAELNTED